ncbi:MAG: hypothetical protein M3Y55_11000 [Pseudomonadota bacterium]|nr:hypothetical protein [Pseudomonadota bacterium]
MKKIILLGAAPVAGVTRYPSEGSLSVDPAIADELITVGLAKADDLDGLKADDARALAAVEGAAIGPAATKADAIGAIQDRRANRA